MASDPQPKLQTNISGDYPKQWGKDAFDAPTKFVASAYDNRQARVPIADRDVCSKLMIIEKACIREEAKGNYVHGMVMPWNKWNCEFESEMFRQCALYERLRRYSAKRPFRDEERLKNVNWWRGLIGLNPKENIYPEQYRQK